MLWLGSVICGSSVKITGVLGMQDGTVVGRGGGNYKEIKERKKGHSYTRVRKKTTS